MGRTKSLFSAIKRVFTSNSKDKLPNELEKRSAHERKGQGRLKHGESRSSFIPLFREPSSIEKILEEVDQQLLFISNPTPVEQPTTTQPLFSGRPASPARISSYRATSPRISSYRADSPRISSYRADSPRISSYRAGSPRAVSPISSPPRVIQRRAETSYRPEPTLRHHHRSATIIQAAYKGYMARRSFRALKGLVRLQGVVRSQHVKRQTVNAMKHMQLLVRVQTQIQSRRIQMLENQALEQQNNKNDKGVESSLGKWNFSNPEGEEHWDDSLLTKEERQARLQRKMEAMIKRERAMAYAYSHQLWKATPKSAQNALTDIRSGGYPWWWNWLERQLPSDEPTKPPQFTPTPPRPRSSRSTVSATARPVMSPARTSTSTTQNLTKHYKPKRGSVASPYPMKDDDSLMSCPPFSVPNYMNPTVSAKAKARPSTGYRDRLTSSAASETSSKRRFSFPLTQTIGSTFKWNKKASGKEYPMTLQAPIMLKKHKSPRSIGDLSMDSSVSMPAAFGRKPFNRFV
ncbi:putative IQ motif, EF-hand binding protein [Helianthus annuus]|uniref:IQ motif, EF-hand binding protein n=1 Tax=Helianthus annuus TaxID=4232 RepID=A0A251TF16_HELAN|nr:protein IQ-DOMAIN 14 [Helianthus annuus]KAF5783071.1 putative IQ motif, EF-hand binding protein [Helianthus annuus]